MALLVLLLILAFAFDGIDIASFGGDVDVETPRR